ALITSMPGIGDILGTEFLAATGADTTRFATPDRLAAYGGLAPVPHDSGTRSGIRHRPRNYHRGLQRVFYQSARISIRCCPASQTYYDRKQGEGKSHTQAVIALARRRVNCPQTRPPPHPATPPPQRRPPHRNRPPHPTQGTRTGPPTLRPKSQ
ncbi:transposase, partial [Streptomyces sp. SID3343]|nr:transposase [Streptomyces sp. SID3343]